MHRKPLNQELVNAFNFMIIPIVMAIVFFLVIHPLQWRLFIVHRCRSPVRLFV